MERLETKIRLFLFLGISSPPFLGIQLSFHSLFVLGFSFFMVAYIFVNSSVYKMLFKDQKEKIA
jgi:hypothetical protein